MNATLSQQRRLLTTAAMVTFGIGFLAGIERGEGVPTARFLIGVGMAFTFCSIMVDLGSPMGAGFAVLVMISAMLYQGEDALKILTTRGKQTGKRPKRGAGKTRAGHSGAARRSDVPFDTAIDPLEGN